jgi:hypothetical protein
MFALDMNNEETREEEQLLQHHVGQIQCGISTTETRATTK